MVGRGPHDPALHSNKCEPRDNTMEWLKFIFMQASAILFAALQFFVLGAAFGAGAWVVWRALDRRASRIKN